MSFLNHAFIVQSNICGRVPDEHPPGIACLPDEAVRHILRLTDSDTLIKIGVNLGNDRLYSLVVDREVWTSLLQSCETFTAQKVSQLAQLANCHKKDETKEVLKQEVLKRAARALAEDHALEHDGARMRLFISIPGGWGDDAEAELELDGQPPASYQVIFYNPFNQMDTIQ